MANSVDLARAAYLWTEQEQSLYNRLPIYMTKVQVDLLKRYQRWTKLLKPINWEANMGNTMQGVHKDRTPILFSEVLPNAITSDPKKNVVEVRELQEKARLYRQLFESNLFHFLPSFADFLTDSIDKTMENINEQIAVYVDAFYRTAIFHGSPQIWVCGKASGTEMTSVPYWTGETVALSKTPAVMQALLAECTQPLTLETVSKIATAAYVDLAVEPFSGDIRQDGSGGEALKHKYCLVTGMETWQNFQFDPFLKENRPLTMNIVTEAFTGDILGRVTSMLERHPIHYKADGTQTAPEVVEGTSDAYDFGRSKPNTQYTSNTSKYAVSFLVGAEAYKNIKVGPPPKEFATTNMSAPKFYALKWNGEVRLTDQLLEFDANGVPDLNIYGEQLKLVSQQVYGYLVGERRFAFPMMMLILLDTQEM